MYNIIYARRHPYSSDSTKEYITKIINRNIRWPDEVWEQRRKEEIDKIRAQEAKDRENRGDKKITKMLSLGKMSAEESKQKDKDETIEMLMEKKVNIMHHTS